MGKANVLWPKEFVSNLSNCLSFYFREENIQKLIAKVCVRWAATQIRQCNDDRNKMKLRYEETIDQMKKSHTDDVENMQDQITELQQMMVACGKDVGKCAKDYKTEQSK